MSKIIYLSAPIGDVTNDERYNERYEFFNKKEEYYRSMGYGVLNPMKAVPRGVNIHRAMGIDYKLIDTADGILMLENWNYSAGCTNELLYATSVGKEVYFEKTLSLERLQPVSQK